MLLLAFTEYIQPNLKIDKWEIESSLLNLLVLELSDSILTSNWLNPKQDSW